MNIQIKELIVQTLFAPRQAARQLIGLRLPRQWLWTSLVLMSILNSIVFSLSLRLSAPDASGAQAVIPPVFNSPVLFAGFLLGGLVLSVFALHWVGQRMGGTADLSDILVLIAWMQVLRLMLQAALALLSFVAPFLGAMVVLVSTVWGLYILTGFVDEGHRFGNWFKSLGVVILSFVAIAVGLTVVLSVLGVAAIGVS